MLKKQESSDEDSIDSSILQQQQEMKKRQQFTRQFTYGIKELQVAQREQRANQRTYQFPADVIERMKVNEEMRSVIQQEYEQAKEAAKNDWFNEVKVPTEQQFKESMRAEVQVPFDRRSNHLQDLLIAAEVKSHLKVVSDLAFDAVDDDKSGQLDQDEIGAIMATVAAKMGVTAPTKQDLGIILQELDDDFDGLVSKDEFLSLIMLVTEKMIEEEEEQEQKVNQDIERDYLEAKKRIAEAKKKWNLI